MSKALIDRTTSGTNSEKAFELKCKKCGCYYQEVGDSKCKHYNLCKNNFTSGATWQREQLIKKFKQLIEDGFNDDAKWIVEPGDFVNFIEELLLELDLLEKGGEYERN